MDGSVPLEFRILGPVEVVSVGAPLPLGGPRQRALLALLLLHANETVSSSRLTDELWRGDAASGRAAAIQNQVARLRKAIGPDRIVTRQAGYSIVVGPGELDLDRHLELVAEAGTAEPGRRSALLAEADSLWRGEALAGLPDAPFVLPEQERLEDLRLATLEERIDADLELGRHADLVGELSALAARYPLQERLREQLMLALYRSGRQAEALDVYRETRSLLADELGLEPSQSLRQLEHAILAQSPSLDAPRRPDRPTRLDLGERDLGEGRRDRRQGARRVAGIAVATAFLGAAGLLSAYALTREGTTTSAAPATSAVQPTSAAGTQASTTSTPKARATNDKKQATSSRRPRTAATDSSSPSSPPPAPAPTSASATSVTPSTPVATSTSPTHSTGTTPKGTPKKSSAKAPPPATTVPSETTPDSTDPYWIEDEFSTQVVDPTIWHTIREGSGSDVRVSGGLATITIAAEGIAGGTYNTVSAHLGTQCSFPADFDARVDFALLDWAPGNNVRAGIHAFFADGFVGRISSSTWGDEYASWVVPANGPLALAEQSGRLRIARVGSTMTTYIWHKERWTALAQGTSTGTAVLGLEASAGTDFGHQATRVAFDNFGVEATSVVCPPGSMPPRAHAP